jgi:hypothetical protein
MTLLRRIRQIWTGFSSQTPQAPGIYSAGPGFLSPLLRMSGAGFPLHLSVNNPPSRYGW